MIHHFLTEDEIAHLTQLHVVDKCDDLNWRNSKEGKEWRKKHEI